MSTVAEIPVASSTKTENQNTENIQPGDILHDPKPEEPETVPKETPPQITDTSPAGHVPTETIPLVDDDNLGEW